MTFQHVTFSGANNFITCESPHPVAHPGWSQAVVSNQGGASYQANPLPLDISFVPWSCKAVFGWVLFELIWGPWHLIYPYTLTGEKLAESHCKPFLSPCVNVILRRFHTTRNAFLVYEIFNMGTWSGTDLKLWRNTSTSTNFLPDEVVGEKSRKSARPHEKHVRFGLINNPAWLFDHRVPWKVTICYQNRSHPWIRQPESH